MTANCVVVCSMYGVVGGGGLWRAVLYVWCVMRNGARSLVWDDPSHSIRTLLMCLLGWIMSYWPRLVAQASTGHHHHQHHPPLSLRMPPTLLPPSNPNTCDCCKDQIHVPILHCMEPGISQYYFHILHY